MHLTLSFSVLNNHCFVSLKLDFAQGCDFPVVSFVQCTASPVVVMLSHPVVTLFAVFDVLCVTINVY